MVSSASKDCIDSSSSFSNRTFSSTPRRDFTFWISRLPSSSTADEIAASAAISIDISLGFLRDGGEETNGTTMIK
ncbi:hypothetical protein AAHA92_12961 [Salvia divinorum]|uniref:Uncharacterized protein n=1 Tax=Salvia divinorum TaxID=28513 RepID=A0ABD1H6R3_SALDI